MVYTIIHSIHMSELELAILISILSGSALLFYHAVHDHYKIEYYFHKNYTLAYHVHRLSYLVVWAAFGVNARAALAAILRVWT